MKKGVGNFIAIFCIISFVIYVIAVTIKSYNIKEEVNTKGSFTIGYIYKVNIGGRVGNSLEYSFYYIGNRYADENFVKSNYSKNHQIGDTIIIKFLPSTPEKSIIIEDKEYKTCMGLPTEKGWKELPKCE